MTFGTYGRVASLLLAAWVAVPAWASSPNSCLTSLQTAHQQIEDAPPTIRDFSGPDAAQVNHGHTITDVHVDPRPQGGSGNIWTGSVTIEGEGVHPIYMKKVAIPGAASREIADTNRAYAAARDLKCRNLEVPRAFEIERRGHPFVVSTDISPPGTRSVGIINYVYDFKPRPNIPSWRQDFSEFVNDLDRLYHEKGIAHGDIMQNLMMREEGGHARFALIDWDGRTPMGERPQAFVDRQTAALLKNSPGLSPADARAQAEKLLTVELHKRDVEMVNAISEKLFGADGPKLAP